MALLSDMKYLSQRWPRALPIARAVVLCVLLVTSIRLFHDSLDRPASILRNGWQMIKTGGLGASPTTAPNHAIKRPDMPPGMCLPEVEFLRRPVLDLSDKIAYSRRCVRPAWGGSNRDVVMSDSEPLIPDATTVDLAGCSDSNPLPCDDLMLQVSYAYPDRQYSHLAFGVASTYERLSESLPAFAHWLADTGALLVAVVTDADATVGHGSGQKKWNVAELEASYAAMDITAKFTAPALKTRVGSNNDAPAPVEQHHFMLVRDVLRRATRRTKWIGILDDDTFFPSLYPLDRELGNYDATQEVWIGNLSDDFGSVKKWGIMAFGGAGVFLSTFLARTIEPLLEQCVEDSNVETGDGMLTACIYAHTRTKLTIMPDLNQHDIRGDVSGFFESGARPLSLHHWKSWYREPVPKMAAITTLCGDCFLQRWRFGNNTLLANGYSITYYPDGLVDIDLDKSEGTWLNAGSQYEFSLGPLRPMLRGAVKKSYRLKDVQRLESGDFRQIYVHRTENDGAMDEVVELLWQA